MTQTLHLHPFHSVQSSVPNGRLVIHPLKAMAIPSRSTLFQNPDAFRLPAELWTRIFEWSAFVPGLMDVEVIDSPDGPFTTPPDRFDTQALRASLRTTRGLTLVCRQFYLIAMPVLYQCVLVNSGKAAQSLARALQASESRSVSSVDAPRPLGSRIRHLVVSLRITNDYMMFGPSITPLEFLHLHRIVTFCTNLEILSLSIPVSSYVRTTPYFGEQFTRTVIDKCGHSLRKLHLDEHSEVLFAPSDCHALLSSMPNLRTIMGGEVSLGCPATWPLLSNLSFATVIAGNGHCHDDDVHQDINPFPSIRHALFRPFRPNCDIISLRHFLSLYGQQLTSAYLDLRYGNARMSILVSLSTFLSSFKDHCPNLQRLDIHLFDEEDIPRLKHLPYVIQLGVAFERPLDSTEAFAALCKKLPSIAPKSVRSVRLLNPHMMQDIQAWASIELKNIYPCPGFRMEDRLGQELTFNTLGHDC